MGSEEGLTAADGWGVRREGETLWHLVREPVTRMVGMALACGQVTRCGRTFGEGWYVGLLATPEGQELCGDCAAALEGFAHCMHETLQAMPSALVRSAQEERAAIAAWLRRDPLARIAQAYAQGIELGLHWGETERQALEAARAKKEGDESARAELRLAGKRLGEVAEAIARRASEAGSRVYVLESDDHDFLSDLGAALVEYFGNERGWR